MKIRHGFVSNSSSSSFVVLLPTSFTLSFTNEQLDQTSLCEEDAYCVSETEDGSLNYDTVRQDLARVIATGQVGEYDEPVLFWALRDLIPPDLILSQFDVSSDCGEITFITERAVQEIVDRYNPGIDEN